MTRKLLGIAGSVFAIACIVVLGTFIFSFISHVWFGKGEPTKKPHVAVLDVEGVLFTSKKILHHLDDILDTKSTKAIVVRINSPGGVVAPAQEIFEALKRADQQIPVIVSMGSLAASGGYYIAMGGRKIFASPGTLTASIGVIAEFVNTQKLYQWAKVERFSLTAGKLKDAGSPFKPMSPEDKAFFQALLNDVHTQFRQTVKERRKLSDKELENTTDGRVMTGSQAYTAKLVDALGGMDDAIREAKAIAKLPDSAEVVYPESPGGPLKKLLLGEPDEKWDSLLGAIGGYLQTHSLGGSGWRVLMLADIQAP